MTLIEEITNLRRKARNRIVFFWLGVTFIFLSSCSEGEIYYRYRHVQNAEWFKDSTLVFKIDSLAFKPMQQYDISIEISSSNSFPYQNLWLYLEHNFSDSVFHRDSLQITINNDYGKPMGHGVGGLHQLSVPYKTQIFRDSVHAYEFRVRQAMADDPLIGIEKVGLKIQEKP